MNPIDMNSRFEQIVLDRLAYVARSAVSKAFLHDVEVRTWAFDQLIDQLVVELQKNLLVHRVQVDDADVPVEGKLACEPPRDVLVELPNPWWRRLFRLSPRTVWCPVVGHAAVVGDVDSVQVRGTAKVRAEYFRAFPEATIQYPPNLGPVRMLVRSSEPYWTPEVSQ